jgi:hypothetical protein
MEDKCKHAAIFRSPVTARNWTKVPANCGRGAYVHLKRRYCSGVSLLSVLDSARVTKSPVPLWRTTSEAVDTGH